MVMKIGWTVSVLVLCALAHASSARTVLVFGDSLSTAFGMDETQGWVHLLGERLEAERPAPASSMRASTARPRKAG